MGTRPGPPTPAAGWLDAEQQRAWRALVEGAQRLFDTLDHELKADAGIDLDQYEVLVRLSEAGDGRLRMSELAEQVCMSRSRLTHRIDKMVEAGLVERVQCPDDRRGMHAALTATGRARLEAAAPAHVDGVRRHLIEPLDPAEVVAIGDAMARVAAQLESKSSAR